MGVLDLSLSSAPQLASYIRTSLRLVHFSGLSLGLGGAVFLDLSCRATVGWLSLRNSPTTPFFRKRTQTGKSDLPSREICRQRTSAALVGL